MSVYCEFTIMKVSGVHGSCTCYVCILYYTLCQFLNVDVSSCAKMNVTGNALLYQYSSDKDCEY